VGLGYSMAEKIIPLFEAAYQCIQAATVSEKIQLTQATVHAWNAGTLSLVSLTPPRPIQQPGYPQSLQLVPPKAVWSRSLHTPLGQVALLHALAHIEFNAINLAWDAIYQFRDLPEAYYTDWLQIAEEESLHFSLLLAQLQKCGYQYGDFPAHNGLWEMAMKTADDVLIRMALVPRVLEARGLDATPAIIEKLQAAGQTQLVEILQRILTDELGHVATGSRWFHYFCTQRQLDPQTTFQQLLKEYFKGRIKGPLNTQARLTAGFSEAELEWLLAYR